MDYLFVDRIDGKKIICEDVNGQEIMLKMEGPRQNIKEGDVIYVDKFGNIFVDKEKTHARKKEILNLREKLKKIDN